ncbi:Chemotaxis protein CheY [Sporomusa silvacetica DSM 10669]|uniref:Chemotaxis protein CheY n=1 Tax=Sporomusa silvacetica DSM 10669 TaxID=1123289 RepID=A0ABZ3IU64_9FIRM|nr:response regulator [Sporomusa silvacetica]OZC19561.1 chemotaxis protein CheY [Sporomusa silvacetica DSM 10669]
MRALVVDDSKISRDFIISHLHEMGITMIEEAVDGFDAINKIKKLPSDRKYDLITLDVVMPKKDGLEALKDIKLLSPASKIIICSSNNDAYTVQIAIGFGVDGFVVKPFSRQKFLDALWRSLKIDKK